MHPSAEGTSFGPRYQLVDLHCAVSILPEMLSNVLLHDRWKWRAGSCEEELAVLLLNFPRTSQLYPALAMPINWCRWALSWFIVYKSSEREVEHVRWINHPTSGEVENSESFVVAKKESNKMHSTWPKNAKLKSVFHPKAIIKEMYRVLV